MYMQMNYYLYEGLNNISLNDWSTPQKTFPAWEMSQKLQDWNTPQPSIDIPSFDLGIPFPSHATPQLCFPSLHTQPQFSVPPEEDVYVSADYSRFFTSDKIWESREEAFLWAREIAMNQHFCIKKWRNKPSTPRALGGTWLPCDRHGQNVPKGAGQVRDITRSKKCGCPFMLRLKEGPKGLWRIIVQHGTHNHVIADNLYGSALAGRPTAEEKEIIRVMTVNHCKPLKIHTTIHSSPGNLTKMKQVYRIMHEIRKKGMEGRTVVQQFFYECNEKGYFMEHRFNKETNKITDIFFASQDQLRLLKAFPYIVLLDSTYATNWLVTYIYIILFFCSCQG